MAELGNKAPRCWTGQLTQSCRLRLGRSSLVEVRHILQAAQRAALVIEAHARRNADRFALGLVATPMGRLTKQVIEGFGDQAGPDVLRLVELQPTDQVEVGRRPAP